MIINSNTTLYAILGNPVKHSLSPIMHNAAFAKCNLNSVYMAFQPDNIKDAVNALKTLGIKGASVTIPFKSKIMEHLDEIDDLAIKIGAVNTILNNNNKLYGFNTDGIGAMKSLLTKIPTLSGKTVLIVGTGGSSRSIAYTLLTSGANVMLAGRGSTSHKNLYKDLSGHYSNIEYVESCNLSKADSGKYDIIINTTPLGMKPASDPLPLKEELISTKHLVFDIVYSPHNTELLKKAKSKGCQIVYGREMLIFQGGEQFKIWHNQEPPIDIMREAILPYLEK